MHTDKLKERVQKLLNQAADRDGTPEGQVFYDKAFALMAQYGFDERDLEQGSAAGTAGRRQFEFAGAYTDMQAGLLNALVEALHCTGFISGKYRSNKVSCMTVFGLKQHLERVDMLFALLNPQMLALAKHVTGDLFTSTVVARRSFMTGFAARIAARLKEAEQGAAGTDDAARDRYALVLLDDADKAMAARDAYAQQHGLSFSTKNSKRQMDARAYWEGSDSADRTDIGQRRMAARRALTA